MATVISPNWGITNLSEGQGSAEVTVNTFVDSVLDFATTFFRVKSASTNAEPASPTNGDCYILTTTPSGTNWDPLATDANAKKIAYYYNGWTFYPIPTREGFHAWVDDVQALIRYDIVQAAWVHFLRRKHSDALTAAGTTQGTALVLVSEVNRVSTSAAANSGVKLPDAQQGLQVLVHNADGADAVLVYPFSGDAINALGANNAFSLGVGLTARFYAMSTSQWYTL